MKFKISVLAIIFSTVLIIALMSFLLNRTSGTETAKLEAREDDKEGIFYENTQEPVGKKADRAFGANTKINDNSQALGTGNKDAEKPKLEGKEDDFGLSKEDIKKIKEVAKLSDADLSKEISSLKSRVENEDLINKLENKTLPHAQETEVKELLERFALLGLEGTRRKYMDAEPELKDPLYAHKDSLQDIRELLEDDEDE